jgi:hypothetical protein
MWNTVFFLKLISGPNEPTPLPSGKASSLEIVSGLDAYTSQVLRWLGVYLGAQIAPHNWVTLLQTGRELVSSSYPEMTTALLTKWCRDPTVNEASLRSITSALILHPIGTNNPLNVEIGPDWS